MPSDAKKKAAAKKKMGKAALKERAKELREIESEDGIEEEGGRAFVLIEN